MSTFLQKVVVFQLFISLYWIIYRRRKVVSEGVLTATCIKKKYRARSKNTREVKKLTLAAIFCAIISVSTTNVKAEPCVGKFVNPITDICWSCIFPVKIGNTSIYSGGREDTKNSSKIPCICDREITGVKVPTTWDTNKLLGACKACRCYKDAILHGESWWISVNEECKEAWSSC